jgi:hypothetical protein
MEEVLNLLIQINENLKNKKDDLLNRKEVAEQYNLTELGVAKIFNMKNAPIIKIGKEQKISRSSLEKIFQRGIEL